MDNSTPCSDWARACDAALAGTAPLASAYLLVDYAGPWPAQAFADNVTDPAAGRDIADRCASADVRPLFIRRPGSPYTAGQREFQWAYVDALTGTAHWHEPATLRAIADAPWPDRTSPTARPRQDPIYLVCTHGRRDQCCATRGRPVAAEFQRLRPEQTWECSHVGGHRLAGVVVALPRGEIYGRVDPSHAAAIVTATERGEVHLPLLRGSSSDEPVVQAAKIAAMRWAGLIRPDALHVAECEQIGERNWKVLLGAPDGSGAPHGTGATWSIIVDQRVVEPAPASCGKSATETLEWQARVARDTNAAHL